MADDSVYGQQSQESSSSEYNALVFVISQILNRVQTVSLVRVVKVYSAGEVQQVGMLDVQPLVNQMTGDRKSEPHGTIFGIPYFRLQGGKNAVIIDPEVGDIGMCGFCSRDISAVKVRKDLANPGSYRVFDWADGLYLGGFLNGIPEQWIQFSTAGIVVHSPVKIRLEAPAIEISGADTIALTTKVMTTDATESYTVTSPEVTFNASTSYKVTSGAITFTGPTEVDGAATFTSTIDVATTGTFGTDANIGGISFIAHVHISAAPGNPTSPPQ